MSAAPPAPRPATTKPSGGAISGSVLSILFAFLQFATLCCAVISTPIAWFVPEGRNFSECVVQPQMGGSRCFDGKDRSCFTLWGYKMNCSKAKYAIRTQTWGCNRRKNNMIAASVFAIASIVFALVLLILGILMMLNIFKHNILITVMSVVAFVCMLICWACPLDVYNSKFCKGFYLEDDNGYAWKSFTDLSAGFVLMVVASGLQLINILVGFVA